MGIRRKTRAQTGARYISLSRSHRRCRRLLYGGACPAEKGDRVPVPLSDIVLWANLFVATGVVLTLAVSLIRFFRHGDEAEISFLKFKVAFRPNQRLVELQKAIDKLASEQRTLDADSRQKKNIMLFFGALLDELGVLLQVGNPADYRANRDRCFTFALSGLVGQLTKEPDNVHRAAIFLPGRDSTVLHLARGPQHNGRRRTLPIDRSLAGLTWKTERRVYAADVLEEQWKHVFDLPTDKSSQYRSIACTPIVLNGMVKGVLSLDGQKPNSFTETELSYLDLFAAYFAILLELDEYQEERLAFYLERRGALPDGGQEGSHA